MVPKYAARAARGLARLKRHYNDIEIFVEDTKNRNMWLELIRAIIPDGVRLKSINQLGGRDAVIKACRLDQEDDGRKKLYIIDGDFDHILERRKPRLRYLYRIRSYCIENLLIHRGAVHYIGAASKPEWSEADIDREFAFDTWLSESERLLRPLFRAYAVVNKIDSTIATTSFSVSKLFLNTAKGASLDEKKVYRRIHQLLKECVRSNSIHKVRQVWDGCTSKVDSLSISECASGKDYLFPLFFHRLNKVLSFRGTPEQAKVHLARAFEPSVEPWLARRIRALC